MDFPLQPCPCCGHRTLQQACTFEICPVCLWEDDPNQREDILRPGANPVTLAQARENYDAYAASTSDRLDEARPPLPHEQAG